MGEELQSSDTSKMDLIEFRKRLDQENRLLCEWFRKHEFDDFSPTFGFELEGWLLDRDHLPSPMNQELLASLDNPSIVSELSQHNFEINSKPHPLSAHLFSRMHDELTLSWGECQRHASKLGCSVMMVGIPPTLRDDMLTPEYLSKMNRYYTLSKRILDLRGGNPIQINIKGVQDLHVEHHDIMTEAAATSFQIHSQIPLNRSVRYYNASQILAGPMVAITANSPFLYGAELWDETRIPVFEQTISVTETHKNETGQCVTFGESYVRESLFELFQENRDRFPIILPILFENQTEHLRHLKLLNGTVWRWNRPIIGFNSNGKPHLRIEHRAIPSGPSIEDLIANTAFYVGLQETYAHMKEAPENLLPFQWAKKNFYSASQSGLRTSVRWIDGKEHDLQKLILDRLIPEAEEGLKSLGIDFKDIQRFLQDVIRARARTGRNGASWQKSFIHTHGRDFQAMAQNYLSFQRQDIPVHQWTV